MSRKAPSRAGLIKLIHVAKRELGMENADYQAMLMEVTGRESCSQLKVGDLIRVMDAMKAAGFEVRPKRGQAPLLDQAPQSRKIRALWLSLHGLGAVRDPSEAALAAFVKRQTGVERLEWLNNIQASDVIEALKRWQKRVEKAQRS